MKRLIQLLLFLVIFFLPVACVFARTVAEETPMGDLVHHILVIILEALAAVIAGLLIRAAKKFGDKTGLEIKYAEEADAKDKLRDIILSVEEKFLSKFGIEDKAKRGGQKLADVITKALVKLPFLKAETVKQWVHEELPKLGLGMLGKKNGSKPVGNGDPKPDPSPASDPQ